MAEELPASTTSAAAPSVAAAQAKSIGGWLLLPMLGLIVVPLTELPHMLPDISEVLSHLPSAAPL